MNETKCVCDKMGLYLDMEVKEREVSNMIPTVTVRMMILLIETWGKGEGILSEKMINLILDVGSRSQSQIIYLMSLEFSLGTWEGKEGNEGTMTETNKNTQKGGEQQKKVGRERGRGINIRE